MSDLKRVYFPWGTQYVVASTEQEDEFKNRYKAKLNEGESLLITSEEGAKLALQGKIVIDPTMHEGGSKGMSQGNVQRGRIQMNITPSADNDGTVRIGWNTLISYMDSDAALIKTADTVIGGDFSTNTLLHLCSMPAYGKFVIRDIEMNASAEGVFGAIAPTYVTLNANGEKRDKKLPFPAADSKDQDNTLRVYDAKYLAKLGVELEFNGTQYLKLTTPKTLSTILTLTVDFYPR